MTRPESPLHVTFVCTGNICRSPMAEKIFAEHLRREALDDRVMVSSAGTHGWHVGREADIRTNETLKLNGYPTGHTAAEVGPFHLGADLVVALAANHDRELAHMGVPDERRRLLRSFDPDADTSSVPDPFYGDLEDFERVRLQIEAAVPGLLDWVRSR
ncbi:low molecular weight protein-tyrosine-phosphatase [Rhodococcus sp. T7]|uniref:low molecular weight protein-tyrosine-phosphatase n=1 Tax=Rhodococcus sp. T7 TaxID=627444 RepID=UPI0013568664|nr:low molecular weight protein-tyrosine-phosphatase [Rhodococcus sp. T7]KAF0961399.1 putative low molecular weight protein-tyrosine-phosphatase [Rhodococcus sp. T7]